MSRSDSKASPTIQQDQEIFFSDLTKKQQNFLRLLFGSSKRINFNLFALESEKTESVEDSVAIAFMTGIFHSTIFFAGTKKEKEHEALEFLWDDLYNKDLRHGFVGLLSVHKHLLKVNAHKMLAEVINPVLVVDGEDDPEKVKQQQKFEKYFKDKTIGLISKTKDLDLIKKQIQDFVMANFYYCVKARFNASVKALAETFRDGCMFAINDSPILKDATDKAAVKAMWKDVIEWSKTPRIKDLTFFNPTNLLAYTLIVTAMVATAAAIIYGGTYLADPALANLLVSSPLFNSLVGLVILGHSINQMDSARSPDRQRIGDVGNKSREYSRRVIDSCGINHKVETRQVPRFDLVAGIYTPTTVTILEPFRGFPEEKKQRTGPRVRHREGVAEVKEEKVESKERSLPYRSLSIGNDDFRIYSVHGQPNTEIRISKATIEALNFQSVERGLGHIITSGDELEEKDGAGRWGGLLDKILQDVSAGGITGNDKIKRERNGLYKVILNREYRIAVDDRRDGPKTIFTITDLLATHTEIDRERARRQNSGAPSTAPSTASSSSSSSRGSSSRID